MRSPPDSLRAARSVRTRCAGRVRRPRRGWKRQVRSWQGVSDHDGVKQRGSIGRACGAAKADGKGVAAHLAPQGGAGQPLVADGRSMALTQLAANIKAQAAGAAFGGKKRFEQVR